MQIFNRKTQVDGLIMSTLSSMSQHDPDSKEYQSRLSVAERLTTLKAQGQKRVSWDVVITVLGNLFGILIIVMYEQRHVFTTKALGFIGKKP